MHLISVVLKECSEYIYDRLNKEIDFFRKEGICIERKCFKQGKGICVEYHVNESDLKNYTCKDFENLVNHYMANALSDIIINELEEKIVNKMISNHYYYFMPKERQLILKHLKSIQEKEAYQYKEGVYYAINRKAKMLHAILEYLRENKTIHLEGFIQFRLKNYWEELENNIDKAVEDFLMEKEYNEFIRLLRYFVDIQEAKIDVVNVLMNDEGKYHLYDRMHRMLNNEYLEDIAYEMADKDISYDDLLISSLITLAPKKIVIHFSCNIKKREIIDTIKNVFADRVYMCNGCEFCLPAKNVKQE
ncbi:putative sporulation protein YtxC [Clostridiaceae bacterium 35-E11]